jgi:hypothetical protein
MTVESANRPLRVWGITIETNREMTLWMAVLFVVCGLLLGQEIHYAIQDHFVGPEPLRMSYWSIFHRVFEAIVAIYFFMFAFRFPKKSVKIASALMGANFAVFVLLSCFPISSTVGHGVAVIGSAVRQIALLTFCLAIAQWFKSSIRRRSPESLGSNS